MNKIILFKLFFLILFSVLLFIPGAFSFIGIGSADSYVRAACDIGQLNTELAKLIGLQATATSLLNAPDWGCSGYPVLPCWDYSWYWSYYQQFLETNSVTLNIPPGCHGKIQISVSGNAEGYSSNAMPMCWIHEVTCTGASILVDNGHQLAQETSFETVPRPQPWVPCVVSCSQCTQIVDGGLDVYIEYPPPDSPDAGNPYPITVTADAGGWDTIATCRSNPTSIIRNTQLNGNHVEVTGATFIPDPVPCTSATEEIDCPPDEVECVNNDRQTTTYTCDSNVCTPHVQPPNDCGDPEWVIPAYYSCNCAGLVCDITRKWKNQGCDSANGAPACFVRIEDKVEECARPQAEPRTCDGNSVYERITFQKCDSNPDHSVPLACYWAYIDNKIQECGGCAPTGSTRCSGSIVQREFSCSMCAGSPAACQQPGTIEWRDAIDCGPPSSSNATYCAGGVKCTLTADYPGECSSVICSPYDPPICVPSTPYCVAPSIDIVCNGPCDNTCTPGSTQACADGGTQTCGADGQWGPCDNGSHNICNTQKQCIAVDGSGANQCQNGIDCDNNTHNGCNVFKQCVVIGGYGVDQCQNNNDCANNTHNECNASEQCVAVSGDGADQCGSDNDCVNNTHNECDGQLCKTVNGVGVNRCQSSNDCASIYKECNDQQQCVSKNGIGTSTCQDDSSCVLGMHNECNNQKQCITINGDGADQCQNESDCENNTHNECGSQQCVVVDGTGVDQCQNDSQCIDTPPPVPPCPNGIYYNECQEDGCVSVCGIGQDECQNDSECIPPPCPDGPHHTECIGENCVCVAGEGEDECQNSGQCIPPVCPDGPHHTECVEGNCVCVAGEGEDECQNDSQCRNPNCLYYNHHLDCVYGVCECVEGAGDNLCQVQGDICVDNELPFAYSLTAGPGSPCTGMQGTGIAYFLWYYGDQEGDMEKKFILQIDNNSDFSSPEVYRTFDNLSLPTGTLNQQTVLVGIDPTIPYGDYLEYEVDYYWRVMVQARLDNGSVQSSDWIPASETFTMTGHPAPYPKFTFDPVDPEPGTLVNFLDDTSICYSNSGPYACQSTNPITGGSNSKAWWFGDPNIFYDNDPADVVNSWFPSHTYSAAKPSGYTATLQVCDEVNCCSIEHLVPVKIQEGGGGLPKWKEISPFK